MSSIPKPAIAALLAARRGTPKGSDRGGRATLHQRADVLASVPLFADLPKRHVRRLAADAQEVDVAAGDVVVRAGQPGRAFFVILEGRAKVVAGAGRAIARLGAGDHFGELPLLDGQPRTASVVAKTDIVAMRLPRSTFHDMLRTKPGVAAKLLETFASIIRKQSVLPAE